MQDIHAKVRRASDTHKSVHVRPVHVNQPAPGVNQARDLPDLGFEDAQRIGIRQHQPRDVFGQRAVEFRQVNAAARVGLDVSALHSRRWWRWQG